MLGVEEARCTHIHSDGQTELTIHAPMRQIVIYGDIRRSNCCKTGGWLCHKTKTVKELSLL